MKSLQVLHDFCQLSIFEKVKDVNKRVQADNSFRDL